MEIELAYPIFVLPKNNSMIYVYFREKDLKSTSETLLKKIDYSKMELIDASGGKYRIKNAFKTGYRGIWGFNPLLKGRQILIDFEYFPDVEKMSLSDFQAEIIERIEKNKRFWESGWDINELRKRVQDADNFAAIAKLLA